MKVLHHWLQKYFDDNLPSPEEIETKVGLHSFEPDGREGEGENTVYDFDVLPNRAHDCLSHRGIAREISAIFNLKINPLSKDLKDLPQASEEKVVVDNQEPERASRYTARLIKNIDIKTSPDWLRNSLIAIGQNPKNNIVDATNYVMFDIGQPLHAFDADKISGKIIIRKAKAGETMTTLDNQEVTFNDTDLVIADEEKILAIAGVKGGIAAAITNDTKNIILEAAHFHPTHTRKTSRRLKILTDSSKRFENEPTPHLPIEAMDYVSKLIISLAGTEKTTLSEVTDSCQPLTELPSVNLNLDHLKKLLGTDINTNEVADILNRLSFKVETKNDNLIVTPPNFRLDISIEEDLIEEVGRMYGYNQIKSELIEENIEPKKDLPFLWSNLLKAFLANKGYNETYSYTFTDNGKIKMANVQATDKAYLRTNLSEQNTKILATNSKNTPLFNLKTLKSFEIGTVWNPDESTHLFIAIDPLTKKSRNQGTVQEIENDINEFIKNNNLFPNSLKVIAKDKLWLEYDLTNLFSTDNNSNYPDLPSYIDSSSRFTPFSSYPFILRDIALWVPKDTDPKEIESTISNLGTDLLKRFDQFDCFAKDDRTSYAYRLVFQSDKKTLTDDEINEITTKIYQAFQANDWEAR